MSRMVDEQRKGRSNGKGSVSNKPTRGIYTFHPTNEQKVDLAETAFDLPWAVEVINSVLAKGVTISLGLHTDKESLWAIARTNEESWEERQAVSVWHSEADRALIGLAYYLTRVNPNWPDIPSSGTQLKFDW